MFRSLTGNFGVFFSSTTGQWVSEQDGRSSTAHQTTERERERDQEVLMNPSSSTVNARFTSKSLDRKKNLLLQNQNLKSLFFHSNRELPNSGKN